MIICKGMSLGLQRFMIISERMGGFGLQRFMIICKGYGIRFTKDHGYE